MRTRDGHGIGLSADGSVVSGAGFGSDPVAAEATTGRRSLAVGLAVALAVALTAALVVALTGGRDVDVVVAGSVPADQPVGSPALGLTVDVPDPVVAGEHAQLTVRWTDGTGILSGSSEDWGDGVATSSRKQGRCAPGAAAPPPAAGTYRLGHAWSEPGTYTVVAAVATYTCENGSAVEEQAARTLTVEVLPRG